MNEVATHQVSSETAALILESAGASAAPGCLGAVVGSIVHDGGDSVFGDRYAVVIGDRDVALCPLVVYAHEGSGVFVWDSSRKFLTVSLPEIDVPALGSRLVCDADGQLATVVGYDLSKSVSWSYNGEAALAEGFRCRLWDGMYNRCVSVQELDYYRGLAEAKATYEALSESALTSGEVTSVLVFTKLVTGASGGTLQFKLVNVLGYFDSGDVLVSDQDGRNRRKVRLDSCFLPKGFTVVSGQYDYFYFNTSLKFCDAIVNVNVGDAPSGRKGGSQ